MSKFFTDQSRVKVGEESLKKNLEAKDVNLAGIHKHLDPVLETGSEDFVDITPEQELFMDGTEGVVSSKGRKPVSGMNLGTYIPPKINIDGKWYDNPSNIGGDRRGCWGFFPEWENCTFTDPSLWDQLNGITLSQEGDWLKAVCSVKNGYTHRNTGFKGSKKLKSVLVKRGKGNLFFGSESKTTDNCYFNWNTNTFINPTDETSKDSVLSFSRISEDLVLLRNVCTEENEDNFLIQLEASGDYCYLRDCQIVSDASFIPPYGMDGNAQSSQRLYPFTDWEKPISFKFKVAQDYSQTKATTLLSDNGQDPKITCHYSGYSSDRNFTLLLNGVNYYYGHNGSSWDGGTAVIDDATKFTSNEDLHQEHEMVIFADKAKNHIRVWFDGQLLTDLDIDLSAWSPAETLAIGCSPNMSESSSGYITNFCVHPKDVTLPIDQSKPFKDPNKQYGKNAQWFLDQFGNFPGSSLLSGAGRIIEEGRNMNGNWVRFINGLLIQWNKSEATYTEDTGNTVYLPTAFSKSMADGGFTVITQEYNSGIVGYAPSVHHNTTYVDRFTVYPRNTVRLGWIAIGY